MIRLFVAVEVPEARKQPVADGIEGIRERVPGARWTSPTAWHVTLKFLGATPEERLDEVTQVVARAATAAAPAEASLNGLGAFPGFRRARVLWVGLDEPGGVLTGLARSLEDGFEPLGFPKERRPWSPHLTIARFKVPAALGLDKGQVGLDDGFSSGPFGVEEVVLFRSHLKPQGAVYEALSRFRLGG